jgi:hypothetical protein
MAFTGAAQRQGLCKGLAAVILTARLLAVHCVGRPGCTHPPPVLTSCRGGQEDVWPLVRG